MKIFKLILLFSLFIANFSGFSQDNTPELIRNNKVKQVKQYIKILAFNRPTDTCLISYTNFDIDGNPIENFHSMECQGFKSVNRTKYEYKTGRLFKMYFTNENGPQYNVTHFYNKKGELIKQEFFYHQFNDISTTNYTYFKNKKTKDLDSFVTISLNPYDGNKNILTAYEYQKDKITKVNVFNEDRKPIMETIYEYDSLGNLINQMYTSYDGNASMIQTTFVYKDGKLYQTVDQMGRTSVIIFLPNELLYQIRRFNVNSDPDSDIFYFYEYYQNENSPKNEPK